MKRHENQPTRPTAGCLSVPLFNQKKRSRMPVTSNPSENEFCLSNAYMSNHSPASSNSASGTSVYYQNQPAGHPQSKQWNREGNPQSHQQHQQYGNNRPAPGPAPTARSLALIPHPYKAGNTSSPMRQPSNPVGQQDSRTNANPRQNNYQPSYNSGSTQSKPVLPSGSSEMPQQQLPYRQTNPSKQYSTQQSRPPPPPSHPPTSRPVAPAPQPQTASWRFKCTDNSGPQSSTADNRSTYHTQIVPQTQTPVGIEVKSATENSLRILTSRIDGMRHWSQFMDKTPYLYEIFATLDSAVTVGSYGAKSFLMRDGKEVVQCVFYENELELPRFIRGQVHRCVGNYDRTRNILICVSVRAGLPSEQRNAQEAVKACDAEMRAVAKLLSEV